MATSNQERLKLGSLELNDETNFVVESLKWNPAVKKSLWASNADQDGEALVRASKHGTSSFEMRIRIARQPSIEAGLEKLGALKDAVEACENVEGGQALEWQPATTVVPYTAYVTSAEITELPIEATGENAGWFLGTPVVAVKMICGKEPFLTVPPRAIKALVESGAEPFQTLYIGGVGGDVPAHARLIARDAASQDRRFAMWGRDVVTSESLPALLLTASSGLTGAGFSGESKTRTGAYGSEKVLRGTAVSQATTLCGTGRIENVGPYAIYLRVYSTSEAARFRISYRSGDGPLRPLEWKQPQIVNGWSWLYVGTVSLDAVTQGTQTGEIRVEQKATSGTAANDINYLWLCPNKDAGKARGIAVNAATNLIAYDEFEQAEGNLEGKKPNFPASGVEWAEVNKTGANGFKVNAAHYLERTAISDANLNSGCFALLGTTSYASVQASSTVKTLTRVPKGASRIGLLCRYVSTEKWVIAVLSQIESHSLALSVIKNVSGVVTTLNTTRVKGIPLTGSFIQQDLSIAFTVLANGTWSATCYQTELEGQDSDLASGGALASGRAGLYEAYTSTAAEPRILDGFQLLGAEEPGRACYSGKQIEFNSQGCLRQDSTGTYDGPPSSYRGPGFELQPAGSLGLINRVTVLMRRNDVEVEEDSAVTDKQKAEVQATERFLWPR